MKIFGINGFLEFLIKIEMFFKRKLEIVVMMNLIRGKNTF